MPRHLFVPAAAAAQAYDDHPLPIGHGQTISQPYIVAFMTEALSLSRRRDACSRSAPGCGYQAAVLARDRRAGLHDRDRDAARRRRRRQRLERLGYANVHVRAGDGYQGWPEQAPFDAIIVITAAAPRVPEPLKQQLRDGGRLIVPVGRGRGRSSCS